MARWMCESGPSWRYVGSQYSSKGRKSTRKADDGRQLRPLAEPAVRHTTGCGAGAGVLSGDLPCWVLAVYLRDLQGNLSLIATLPEEYLRKKFTALIESGGLVHRGRTPRGALPALVGRSRPGVSDTRDRRLSATLPAFSFCWRECRKMQEHPGKHGTSVGFRGDVPSFPGKFGTFAQTPGKCRDFPKFSHFCEFLLRNQERGKECKKLVTAGVQTPGRRRYRRLAAIAPVQDCPEPFPAAFRKRVVS